MGKFICDYCGKEYTRAGSGKNYKKHFCSNECRYKARREKDVIYYEEDYAYILLTKDNTTKKVLFDVEDIEKIKQYQKSYYIRNKDKIRKYHQEYNKKNRTEKNENTKKQEEDTNNKVDKKEDKSKNIDTKTKN